MGSLVGIVVVVIGILASVALHEVGHMVPAKKFGVLVPDYAVGFGPALWKKKIGDTTYALRAILLGGYVKIVGMYAPARPGTRLVGRGGKPTLAQEAREASAEEIPEGQEHRAFYRLSAPKKIAVMLGGPMMNLLICFVLSAIAMMGIGAPTASRTIEEVPTTVMSRVAVKKASLISGASSRAASQLQNSSKVMAGLITAPPPLRRGHCGWAGRVDDGHASPAVADRRRRRARRGSR